MSRYQTLQDRNAAGKPVYLPYVMLGFPNNQTTLDVCKMLIDEGAHGLELGFPFRDPVADGTVIQDAANEALDNGFKTAQGLELVRQIRAMSDTIPLTAMSYYNMVLAKGVENFIRDFADAGLDGLLIPDMPPERAGEIAPIAEKHGIKLIFIAAPNSTPQRLNIIKEYAGGFVYVVTRLGITGEKEEYSDQLETLFKTLHSHIDLPAIAGFGISEPDQAQHMVNAGANGVISGSKLVKLIKDGYGNNGADLTALTQHTKNMLSALA